MKRLSLAVVFFLVFSVMAFSSGIQGPAYVVQSLSVDPACSTTPLIWFNTSSQLYKLCNNGTISILGSTGVSGLFTATASATNDHVNSDTSLIGTGSGSTTTVANYFVAGSTLIIEASGTIVTAGTPDTLNIKIKATDTIPTTTTVGQTSAITPVANLVSSTWMLRAVITCRTAGSSGTFIVNTYFETTNVSPGASYAAPIRNTSTVTLDTTKALTWNLTAAWGGTTAGDTIVSTNFTMLSPTGNAGGGGGGGGAVNTVFGRNGDVVAQSGDYIAAQVTNAVANNAANTYSGGGLQDFSSMRFKLPLTAVGSLPAASSHTNEVYVVTDGVSSSDCSSGGGATRVPCISNGTSWIAMGGGGGTGCTVTGSAGAVFNNGSTGCITDTHITTDGLGNETLNSVTSNAAGAGFFKCAEGNDPNVAATGFDYLFCNTTHRMFERDQSGTPAQFVHAGVDINTSDQVTGFNGGSIPAGATVLGTNGLGQPVAVPIVHELGWEFYNPTGLTTSDVGYITVPFKCTITGWDILLVTGTATVKTWKIANGTALPTSSNSISTSGVSISSGTAVQSNTVTDFTTTTVNQYDKIAYAITALSGGAASMFFGLECTQAQ